MISRKLLGELSFACAIAAISACGFAADAPPANEDGSCLHGTAEPRQSAVNVPDYQSDADAVSDSDQTVEQRAYRDYRLSVFDSLSASADPRDWALAAHIGMFPMRVDSGNYADDAARRNLIARAVNAAPDDALVQWLAVLYGHDSEDAAPTRLSGTLQTLLRLEPNNAAVWYEALTQAWHSHDEAAVDDVLAHMATSTDYNDHYVDFITLWQRVFARYPMPERLLDAQSNGKHHSATEVQFSSAAAQAAATAMLSLTGLMKVCKLNVETGGNWARRGYCADIGHLMTHQARTAISLAIGFAALRISGSASQEDEREARDYYWMYEQYIKLAQNDSSSDVEDESYLVDWLSTGNEIEALRRRVLRAGISPTPPPDWVSPRPLRTSSGYTPSQ